VDVAGLTTNCNNNNTIGPRKILLVDAATDVVTTFKMILKMNCFNVDAHTNPFSALSNFKPHEFGLLILDIRMPNVRL
jgi:FixJ family two-component response regulator